MRTSLDIGTKYYYQSNNQYWGKLLSDNGYDVVIELDNGNQSVFGKPELLAWIGEGILSVISPQEA